MARGGVLVVVVVVEGGGDASSSAFGFGGSGIELCRTGLFLTN
jgi:hypothetical protein